MNEGLEKVEKHVSKDLRTRADFSDAWVKCWTALLPQDLSPCGKSPRASLMRAAEKCKRWSDVFLGCFLGFGEALSGAREMQPQP